MAQAYIADITPPEDRSRRMGLIGMAFGGWLSGFIFDATGSYRAAFVNGVAWNLLNLGLCYTLARRKGGPRLAVA